MPRRNRAWNRAAAAGTRWGGRPPAGRREHRVRFWEAIARGASSEKRCGRGGCVAEHWCPVVPQGWRDAASHPRAGVGALSVLHRAGGDRGPARWWLWGARDRASARSCAVDDLPGAATQRCDRTRPALNIEPRPPRRMPSVAPDDPSRRSSRSTRSCGRYVQDRLAGAVQRPDGSVAGPQVGWRGRRHGPRKDRRWGQCWSPEQISGRLRVDFPDDESMRVSHEAIYQSLYVQGRGALRRELTACLRTGRALRVPRNRTSRGNRSFVTDELLISERPAEVDDRAVPGSLGRRSDPRHRPVGDRHSAHAVAPGSQRRRVGQRAERPRVRR